MNEEQQPNQQEIKKETGQKAKTKTNTKVIVAVIVGLAIIGGGAFAFFWVKDTPYREVAGNLADYKPIGDSIDGITLKGEASLQDCPCDQTNNNCQCEEGSEIMNYVLSMTGEYSRNDLSSDQKMAELQKGVDLAKKILAKRSIKNHIVSLDGLDDYNRFMDVLSAETVTGQDNIGQAASANGNGNTNGNGELSWICQTSDGCSLNGVGSCFICATGDIDVDPWYCFSEETKISMADGSIKKISEVKVGDWVKSYDLKNKLFVSSWVNNTFHKVAKEYISINGHLKVTPEHQFYTIDRQWVKAKDLNEGNYVWSNNDTKIAIDQLETVKEPIEVYNIEVAGYHNYLAEGYLVHNKSLTGWSFEIGIGGPSIPPPPGHGDI